MCASSRPTETVVAGCDSSWESQHAVIAATREASRRGAALVLLAVAEHRPYWPDNLAWVARAEAESTHQATTATERAMERALETDRSVAMRTAVVQESDSYELDRLARRAGLLVLGRRGDGGQVTFSLGSTSAELGRRFKCPMLVVHDQGRPSQRRRFGPDSAVVVGMDIHGAPDTVLAVAVAEAVIRDLPLVVVYALPRGKEADRVAIGEGWRRCREALREAQLPVGVPSRLVVTQDDPAAALLHRVGATDLLVVGTHGQGRLAGLVAGSVSKAVLDKMTCDVLVVQPGLDLPRDPISVGWPLRAIVKSGCPYPLADPPATSEHGELMRDDLTHDDVTHEDVMAGSRPVPWWDQEPEGRPDDNPHIPPRRP